MITHTFTFSSQSNMMPTINAQFKMKTLEILARIPKRLMIIFGIFTVLLVAAGFLFYQMEKSKFLSQGLWVVLLVLAGIVITGAVLGMYWRNQRVHYYKQLLDAELQRKALVKHYEYLVKYANDIILLIDELGGIVEVNDKALASYGYPYEEFLLMKIGDLAAGGGERTKTDNFLLLEEVEGSIYEGVHRRKDGTEFPVEVSLRRISIDERNYFQQIIRDISDRKEAETALRTSEERYRTMYANTPVMMISVDSSMQIVSANKRSIEILGFALEEMIGKPAASFMTERSRHFAESKAFPAALIEGFANDLPFDFVKKNGTVIETQVSAVIEKNEAGKIVRIITTVVDVTDRNKAERALRLLHRKTEDALRAAKMAYWEFSFEKNIFIFNDEFYAMHGTSASEQGGYEMSPECFGARFVDKDFIPQMNDAIDRALASDDPDFQMNMEGRLRRMNGDPFWVTTWFRIEKDQNGKTVKLAGVNQDSTSKKIAEQQQRRSEEQLSLAIEGSAIGLWDWNIQTGELFVNDRWAEIVGYAKEELSPLNIETWNYFCDADDLRKSSDLLEKHFSGQNRLYECEARMKHKDGRTVYVLDRGRVFEWSTDGKPLRMLGTHVDVSEIISARNSLAESEERFRRAIIDAPIPVIIFAEDGAVITVNKAWSALSGYSIEAIPTIDDWLSKAAGDSSPDKYAALLFQTDTTEGERQMPIRTAAGESRMWELNSSLLGKSFDGKHLIIAMAKDVTEQNLTAKAQKEIQEKFVSLFNNSPLASIIYKVCFADDGSISEMRVSDINYHGAANFGLLPAQLIGKSAKDLFDAEAVRQYFAVCRKVHRSGAPNSFEFYYDKVDKYFFLTLFFIGPDTCVNISLDITEKIRAENALKEKENRLSLIFNNTSDFLSLVKTDKGESFFYETINKTYLDALSSEFPGITESDFNGKEMSDVLRTVFRLSEAQIAENIRLFQQAVALQKKIDSEHELFLPGGPRILASTIIPVVDEQGNTSHILRSSRDITVSYTAERILAEEKERLATTVRSISDGVISTDEKGRIVLMNKVAEELTGWSFEEACGKPFFEICMIINERTYMPYDDPVACVLANGNIVDHPSHAVLMTKYGSGVAVTDTSAPIRDKENTIVGVVFVFRDMREKQKFIESTRRTQKLESLSILAGGIAHDFNNLLGGIFGYLSLAQECALPNEKISLYLEKIVGVYNRAKDLTQQLLTFAKGGVPVKKTVSLIRLLKEATQFSLSGSNISVNFNIDENLWNCSIDENQIGQVINNIVLNAQQSMPMGGAVTVSAQNVELAQGAIPLLPPGKYVKIFFEDEGIGIPKEILPRIFDPFFTTKQKGNGLGLAMVFSIIQKHDGFIDVESAPGYGTIVKIYLPVSFESSAAEISADGIIHKGSGRILVMDDEEFIREIASELLKNMGYMVTECSSSDETLIVYRDAMHSAQPFRMVILDLTIPGGKGGRDTITELRKIDPAIPVIATSGYSEDDVMANPAAYGFTDKIRKPYRMRELAELLNRIFGTVI